jgi:hypothetical protein
MSFARVQSLHLDGCPRPSRRRASSPPVRLPTSSHGVWLPFDVRSQSSDQHRAYRTRLCCALRFSQPLDALIPLRTFQPCFMLVPSLGFLSSEGSPSRQPPRLSTRLPFMPFARSPEGDRAWLQGLMHTGDPFSAGRCYPGSAGRSSPDLFPSKGFPSGLGLVLPRSLLSWASASRWTEVHRFACSAECQRTRG